MTELKKCNFDIGILDDDIDILNDAETKLERIQRRGSRNQVKAILHTMATLASRTATNQAAVPQQRLRKFGMAALLLMLAVGSLHAQQSPWGQAAQRLGDEFTGPIARGFALVAIVVGGLMLAFSEGGGRRTIGGLVFGLGLALGAAQFVTWLFN